MKVCHSKVRALRTAYDVLRKMHAKKIDPPDEVKKNILWFLFGDVYTLDYKLTIFISCLSAGVLPGAHAALWTVWPASACSASPF